jgi:hypothetical protein
MAKNDGDVLEWYAQCEDDFKRVEMNYIEKLGRLQKFRTIGFIQS